MVEPAEKAVEKYSMQVAHKRNLDDLEKRLKDHISEVLLTRRSIISSEPKKQRREHMTPPQQVQPTVKRVSIIPNTKTWKNILRFYFTTSPDRYLFVPVILFAKEDRAANAASRLSKSQTLGTNFFEFVMQATPPNVDITGNLERLISEFSHAIDGSTLDALNPIATRTRWTVWFHSCEGYFKAYSDLQRRHTLLAGASTPSGTSISTMSLSISFKNAVSTSNWSTIYPRCVQITRRTRKEFMLATGEYVSKKLTPNS